jgi:ABC-type multidrug transport system fused ATPase/permease subunit
VIPSYLSFPTGFGLRFLSLKLRATTALFKCSGDTIIVFAIEETSLGLQNLPFVPFLFFSLPTMLSYGQPSSLYNSPHSKANAISMPGVRTYNQVPRLKHKHIFIITGPAGCGKTTIAKHLADFYAFPYIEGDDVSLYQPVAP